MLAEGVRLMLRSQHCWQAIRSLASDRPVPWTRAVPTLLPVSNIFVTPLALSVTGHVSSGVQVRGPRASYALSSVDLHLVHRSDRLSQHVLEPRRYHTNAYTTDVAITGPSLCNELLTSQASRALTASRGAG